MSRGDIILRLVDVERIYETKEGRKIVALNKVTTSFKRGEFVAVVGKSGSGKSTLINILGGLDTPNSGDYFLEGNNIAKINEGQWDAIRNEKIGFIFQEYHLVEYLSVYKNVEIALKYQKGTNKKTRKAKIREVLTQVGLIDHINKLPGQLSGGQRQRVAIARALVKDPAIILADEPTGALDYNTSETVIDLIKGLSKERLVIVVTHDRGIAQEHATRIIELTEGQFTSDLIREDIEQTYQNVYRKTKPTNLGFRDKLELTFKKIQSQLLRTFFTALSLALAFSFTILFSGVEKGISESYDAYFEALNKSNSYAFSLVPEDDVISEIDYLNATDDLLNTFENQFYEMDSEIVVGNSVDVAKSLDTEVIEKVRFDSVAPDLLNEFKVRLIDVSHLEGYSYNELFIGDSQYPTGFDELVVTTRFYREYFELSDDIVSLGGYIGKTIMMPEYTLSLKTGLYNFEELMDSLLEENGVITISGDAATGEPIRYLDMHIPDYCVNYNDLEGYYKSYCENVVRDQKFSVYFETIDDYLLYIEDFKTQVENVEPGLFDILLRSGAIYYMVDENDQFLDEGEPRYIERVYQVIHDNAVNNLNNVEYKDGIYRSTDTFKEMVITGIIENDNEAITYFDYLTYNRLFITEQLVEVVDGYYSVNLESGILKGDILDENDFIPETVAINSFAGPLMSFEQISGYADTYSIKRNERIEQGDECAIFTVDSYFNSTSDFDDVLIVGDVFTLADYSGCKVNSDSYHYLNSISILFGVFFNVLMFISIIFFNILLQVILSERIGEIGIYRSVGSTAKDIKILFFMEIIFEIILATVLSIVMIYYANQIINVTFLNIINQGSGVINFAGMKLSIGTDGTITQISFFNLAFYVSVVFLLLGFLSNRNVSKLANTKPIDILRKADD